MHLPPPAQDQAHGPSDVIFCPPTPPSSPPPSALHKSIDRILPEHALRVSQMEQLTGHHLHHLVTIYLSDGLRLVLKVSPSPSKGLLRHERHLLHSEAAAYAVLAKSGLPIPKVFKYESNGRHLGAPFLLTSRIEGLKYADVRAYLAPAEKMSIDKQIRAIASLISRHRAPTFGHASVVACRAGGHATWREAFVAMMDALIMDGEDMMVNLSYYQIRAAVSRWESYLDDITEPRMVVLGLERPENVLVNRRTNEVCGLLDFGHTIWGDPGMLFVEGKTDIRSLLYTCYHSMVTIIRNHYRAEDDEAEMDARKALTRALAQLSVGS